MNIANLESLIILEQMKLSNLIPKRFRKEESNKTEQIDKGRRNFIEKGAKIGAALVAGGTVLKATEAVAGGASFLSENLRKGIADGNNQFLRPGTSKKSPLPTILNNLKENHITIKIPGNELGIELAGKLYEEAYSVRDEPTKLIKFIKEFDYENEPASYFLAGFIYENPWEIATSKEKWAGRLSSNDAMTHYAIEIGQYLNRYLRPNGKKIIAPDKIEEPGLNAIQIASNQNIQDILNGKLNINSISPRNLKILIWATTKLIDHLNPNGIYDKLYSKIEMPIREKYPNLKIRS